MTEVALLHLLFVCVLCLGATRAGAQELRLAAPAELADSGFLKHILPRFKFKHRIVVEPVGPQDSAEMALVADATHGTPVFARDDGQEYRLVIAAPGQGPDMFLDWLTSTPGKSAITSFPRGGPPAFITELPERVVVETVEITGDVVLGSRLALAHCGRCHVVDKRNRMGGIGSTPSFAAMRARPHWIDLFSAYWSQNPHPSFTEVIGVTDPFDETNVTHIAPVRITLDEIDAIVAFVETLKPLDLGRPVKSN
ncbi:MAG: cytochrome c [Rhodobacter sp.]|nr:cytochrome c [Rhodobacter sp.]